MSSTATLIRIVSIREAGSVCDESRMLDATFGGCVSARGPLRSIVWLEADHRYRLTFYEALEGQHDFVAPVIRRHARAGVATRDPRHRGTRRYVPQGRAGSRGGVVSDRCR